MMNRHIALIGLVLTLLLTSCESLTGVSPKGTPRVETELAVVVAPDFQNPLVDVDESLLGAMKQVVVKEADVGLRFYPVLSEDYAPEHARPPYLLTVELTALELSYREAKSAVPEGSPDRATLVDEIAFTVAAKLTRRRQEGPPLLVGSSVGSASVRAHQKLNELEGQPVYATEGSRSAPYVLRADVLDALDASVEKALKALRAPIDRELAPLRESGLITPRQ